MCPVFLDIYMCSKFSITIINTVVARFFFFFNSQVFKFVSVFCLFWPCHMAFGIVIPRPGIKPVFLTLEVQSLNCRTSEKSSFFSFFLVIASFMCKFYTVCCRVEERGLRDCLSSLKSRFCPYKPYNLG